MPRLLRVLPLIALVACLPTTARAQGVTATLPWPVPAHGAWDNVVPDIRLVGLRTRGTHGAAPVGPVAEVPLVDGWAPAHWPAPPAPLAGALLPDARIIAAYGHPASTRMGILGALPPGRLEDSLASLVARWQRADSSRATVGALHMIATVAQGHPGADGRYRLRHPAAAIDRI
ncbi:MAG TPA: hypothetical protein VFX50_00825, partial [Gemmatimonadales bacterium]|nr:hypothetical protein [Gemmatimonadales bacterium]